MLFFYRSLTYKGKSQTGFKFYLFKPILSLKTSTEAGLPLRILLLAVHNIPKTPSSKREKYFCMAAAVQFIFLD